jgi:hypothetical protein
MLNLPLAVVLPVALAGALLLAVPAGARTITPIKRFPDVEFTGLTCSTSRACEAIGVDSSQLTDPTPGRLVTITAGRAGGARTFAGPLENLACSSATDCLAVGSDAGQGSVMPIVDTPVLFSVNAAACVSPATCEAVGETNSGEGVVIRVVDGAPEPARTVAGTAALDGIACPTATRCEAVGRGPGPPDATTPGVVVPIAGGRPGVARPVGGTAELLDVACAAASVCDAVGVGLPGLGFGPGVVVPITRAIPRAAEPVAGTSALLGIACAGVTACEAVGQGPENPGFGSAGVVVPIGRTPGPVEPVPATPLQVGVGPPLLEATPLSDVACPRASSCDAVGGAESGVVVRIDAFACRRTLTGGHVGTLVVRTGSTCLSGARIRGNVSVRPGAAVEIDKATITGSVRAADPADARICGATIGGSVAVRGASGLVLVGGDPAERCPANRIGGALRLVRNTGGLEAIGNHVRGRVTISGNVGGEGVSQDATPNVSGNAHAG